MSEIRHKSTLALLWEEQRTPVQPTPPPPSKWVVSGIHDGRAFTLKVEPFYDQWYWTARLGGPRNPMLVMGYADDAESAKQDAQAVADLYMNGRPVFLDRRPTLSLSAPPELHKDSLTAHDGQLGAR